MLRLSPRAALCVLLPLCLARAAHARYPPLPPKAPHPPPYPPKPPIPFATAIRCACETWEALHPIARWNAPASRQRLAPLTRALRCVLATDARAGAPPPFLLTWTSGEGGPPIRDTPVGWPGVTTFNVNWLTDTDPLAQCNDGSPAAYYYAPGVGSTGAWLPLECGTCGTVRASGCRR